MQHIRQYQPSDRHASLIVPRLSTLVASPCVISSAFRRPDMSGRLTGRSPAAICALTAAHPAVNNIVSSHPDAQRRRQESEDRWARDATLLRHLMPPLDMHFIHGCRTRERDLQLKRERGGMKWWQEASVIQSVDRPEDLKQRLASPGLVVVNFFSEECYSCKTLHPVSHLSSDAPTPLMQHVCHSTCRN